ncbi:glucose-6-phosphate isomerase [Tenacibaculum todarodis]|uniref:Glucose-6-phosphate isomerase n=1 Tax=Tenacibaculum todarodis TaxID=1850252 RepID=A0A1L3JKL5_9FLAO|nr:glucose-6-phosphate isomerase [Tenacibaculum todarodis]APG65668.1 glucose-6-phosphate isomerase [Tenacibaculum todarodis]
MLKNINPTSTEAWKKLEAHFIETKELHLKDLFKDNPSRKDTFSISFNDVFVDYSKNRITEKTKELLLELAEEVELEDAISKYFYGDKINATEDRAVLHTALRSSSEDEVFVEGKDIKPKIQASLRKIRAFSNKVISGKWKGYTGKSITDIVNIGVGGSDLGPNMAVQALQFYKNKLNTHFVSNIDGDHVVEVLKKINPETTLFIVVSKTFTTDETIVNANTIKDWFLQQGPTIFDVSKHFVAVTANLTEVNNFGIPKENVFRLWDWVGGRFSIWSSVGLSISLSVGFDNFRELLNGAEEMDIHFKNEKLDRNIPVIMALIGIWYNNFYKSQTEVILPYSQYLYKLPVYLQQAIMESNGKGVDRNGNPVNYQTGNIILGSTGTNAQHAFMQLLHQGTKLIPSDFIGYKEPLFKVGNHHKKLMANFYAQTDALAFGQTRAEVHLGLKTSGNQDKINHLLPFKNFKGNRPSNSILFEKLTPNSLGKLIAIYEHKVFVQGVVWNIFSYDQFGIELGKELSKKYFDN